MKFNDLVLLAEDGIMNSATRMLICQVIVDYISAQTNTPAIKSVQELYDALDTFNYGRKKIEVFDLIFDNLQEELPHVVRDFPPEANSIVLDAVYPDPPDPENNPNQGVWNWYFRKIRVDKELKNNDHGMDLTF